MNLNSSSNDSFQIDLSLLPQLYPDHPVQNIAVLFTDVVDSTQYFKTHGDVAGREMLRVHQEVASPIVAEFRGQVIKMLGDSVMAYFLSADEALKAAVKMQQKFELYNAMTTRENQIRIRIGIHFGSVIVEEGDIYGDVVNVAAKITNLAKGTQIFVSQDVYDITRHLPAVHFEKVNAWQNNKVLNDLQIYKIVWDVTTVFQPPVRLLLRLCPLFRIAPAGFETLWKRMIEGKEGFWSALEGHERVLPDKTVVVTMQPGSAVMDTARKVVTFLEEGLGQKWKGRLLPVRIVVDAETAQAGGDRAAEKESGATDALPPGGIFVTRDALDVLGEGVMALLQKDEIIADDRRYLRVQSPDPEGVGRETRFLYREFLGRGILAECYYCGGRGHRPADCPSKGMMEVTRAFHRLGFYSLAKINDLFLSYLINGEDGWKPGEDHLKEVETDGPDLARQAFYELRRIFQLRFFRTFWHVTSEEWDSIREIQCRSEGGMAWLAQDSLRVNDIDRAERMLRNAEERSPLDYRIPCSMGFVELERGRNASTEHNLQKALSLASTDSQKIFLLLLLSRFYLLTERPFGAERAIREILSINPQCIEALYQEVLFFLEAGKEKLALPRLRRLIQDNRTYFVVSMIDPYLAPFGDSVGDLLSEMLQQAKEDADKAVEEAFNEAERSAELLSSDENREVEDLRKDIETLRASDSYFGYLDMAISGNSIVALCKNSMKERRRALAARLWEVFGRAEDKLKLLKGYRYRRFTYSVESKLDMIKREAEGARELALAANREQYEALVNLCTGLEGFMASADSRCRRLAIWEQVLANVGGFLKYSGLFLSMVLFMGLVLLPLGTYYLNVLLSDYDLFTASSIWLFQKGFLVLGGVGSLLASFLLTIGKAFKG